ncbi:guanine deaminase [Paracoccus chinensis]|uniref:Guanine deaminase n=1 Tax=Paracoccus chinensis TaxID=525640 RepID=A0A1G9HFC0_9RHOB|nr:guanine deaminase [Paracoccus chinensis]SDL11607.1 guanine deaminase [Paracoccus chinensis]
MTKTLLRGRVLSFHADPAETTDSHRFWENGAILVADGRILAVGDWADIRDPEAKEIDHRPHIIMAGFVDPHIHFPQVQVVAAWAAQLLDWLNDHTFPIEAQYRDPAHAARMAEAFLDQLIGNGTTTVSAFCSVHRESAEALFAAAEARGMAMLAGKVMMDRNAPDAVLDTAQASYDDSRALIERWHGRGRLEYVITPRFAITSTPEQLRAAGTLAAENPSLAVQTHLNENRAEIELTMQLYPEASDYLDIYDRFGMLGPRSLMGHAIHMNSREIARMAETGTRAIHCPTSNLFLGSGLFDDRGMRDAGVVTGVATDIGGGTSWSMLATLSEAYKIAQMRGQRMHPFAAFHWATRGNAIALGIEDRVGSVQPGRHADLVVLDPRATPAMRLRHDKVDSLMQELFILQVMGDDRAVVETYVAGRAMKAGAQPTN